MPGCPWQRAPCIGAAGKSALEVKACGPWTYPWCCSVATGPGEEMKFSSSSSLKPVQAAIWRSNSLEFALVKLMKSLTQCAMDLI